MKKIIYVLSICILTQLFIACGSDISVEPQQTKKLELNAEEQSVLKSSESFGLNIFKNISQYDQQKNLFVSPLSISIALGMALNGAEGETYNEMVNTLELNGLSLQDINDANQVLLTALSEIDPKVKFEFANSCWYDDQFEIEADFIEQLKNFYLAEINKVDMADPQTLTRINNWVYDKTNGKIDKVLDAIPANVVMYLINALYFKADWKYQFKKSETEQREFKLFNQNSIQTDMMKMSGNLQYFQNTNLQAVDLPYGDSTYAMTVILPNESLTVDEVINSLDKNYWNGIIDNMSVTEGLLYLPKFNYKYEIELKDVLRNMGMLKAFRSDAEFTKIRKSGGIYISRVIHKSFIDVNEEGTEAAAVTVVEFRETSVGNNFYMDVNRPFIYVIRELSTDAIIFIGKVENPNSR